MSGPEGPINKGINLRTTKRVMCIARDYSCLCFPSQFLHNRRLYHHSDDIPCAIVLSSERVKCTSTGSYFDPVFRQHSKVTQKFYSSPSEARVVCQERTTL